MKLGAHTACLHDKTLGEALTVLRELGLSGAGVNAGGFIGTPHLPFAQLLASAEARKEYLATFERHGIELTALNCNGNPLHPDPEVDHGEDLKRAIRLAGLLGIDVAVPFWTDVQELAASCGVRVAIEMHPHNLVFNPATLKRLVELSTPAGGINHIGAEVDPSHLFWQHIDPVAAVADLGELVFFVAAKDTLIHEAAAVNGVLDDRFDWIPAEEEPLSLGGRHTVTRWPAVPGWSFVAVGRGHDIAFWTRFVAALAAHTRVEVVNIEHEDTAFGRVEGLEYAVRNLNRAAGRLGVA